MRMLLVLPGMWNRLKPTDIAYTLPRKGDIAGKHAYTWAIKLLIGDQTTTKTEYWGNIFDLYQKSQRMRDENCGDWNGFLI